MLDFNGLIKPQIATMEIRIQLTVSQAGQIVVKMGESSCLVFSASESLLIAEAVHKQRKEAKKQRSRLAQPARPKKPLPDPYGVVSREHYPTLNPGRKL